MGLIAALIKVGGLAALSLYSYNAGAADRPIERNIYLMFAVCGLVIYGLAVLLDHYRPRHRRGVL